VHAAPNPDATDRQRGTDETTWPAHRGPDLGQCDAPRRPFMNHLTMLPIAAIAAATAVALRFVWICLADLARTPDEQLQLFPRTAWALLIVAVIPLGGILYLRYGKGPRRYA
jgi:hypothetical protein